MGDNKDSCNNLSEGVKMTLKGSESELEMMGDNMDCCNNLSEGIKMMTLKGTESELEMCEGFCNKAKGTVPMGEIMDSCNSLSEGVKMMTLKGTESEMGPSYAKEVDERGMSKKRVPWWYLKGLRERKWNLAHRWEGDDLDRRVLSTEALLEHLQDFKSKMVLIGSDVVNLFPSL